MPALTTDPGRARVALATSKAGLAVDPDLPLMVGALRARGLDAVAAAWDEAGFDWAGCDRVVIRSTWDYAERRGEFLAWAASVAAVSRLDNPAPVVRWNTDKRYLRDLAARGVPVVPTRFLAPGEDPVLPEHGHFVVKPAVSAGARDTARYAPHHRALAVRHIAALHRAGATAMVQPYLSRIDEGERALVFLDGVFSHALRKGPVLTVAGVIDNDREVHPGLTPYLPSPAELELAAAALGCDALASLRGREPLLYARADIALADDGTPVVMELELVEPNLFTARSPEGLRRFADAVHARALSG